MQIYIHSRASNTNYLLRAQVIACYNFVIIARNIYINGNEIAFISTFDPISNELVRTFIAPRIPRVSRADPN